MHRSDQLLQQLRIDRSAPESPRSWPWRNRALAAAGMLAALAVVVVLCMPRRSSKPVSPAATRPAAVAVVSPAVVASARRGDGSVLDASGYVVARRMATVSAKVTGKVREVFIEEGMRVEQDQVMATLDRIDADAQLALADSQRASARSEIDNLRAQLLSAEADATRMQTLVARQLVSRSEHDQAIASRDALRAQLQRAVHEVEVADDQHAIALIDLDNTIIRAPFAGVVTAKAAQPGEIVSPLATGGYTRTGIGTIVDMDSLEVEVEVGEAYIGRVQSKMPVEVVLNAYPDWRIAGEVIAIIPTADRGKATVKVRVAIKVKDARVVPDMGVRVSFLAQRQRNDEAVTPRARG